MTPTTVMEYRNGNGKLVKFEELVKEPKFLAWRPPKAPKAYRRGGRRLDNGKSREPLEGVEINPKHSYTTTELGRKWNFHKDTIFDLFRDYQGVLKIVHPETRKRRGYTTIRIPGAVAAKFWREHTGNK